MRSRTSEPIKKEEEIKEESSVIHQRIELLTKPWWSYKEIMSYFNVCKNIAIKIKNKAANAGGLNIYHSEQVSRDKVMELQGTTTEREMDLLLKAKGAIYG